MKFCTFLRLLALSLALLLLPSCGGPQQDDSTTISIMGKKTDLEKSYMQTIFRLYEQETGNHLQIISYEDDSFETLAVEAFEKGNAPDILMHFHNAGLMDFNVEETFLPLNDQPWVSDLTDSAKAYCTDSDGNLLGLPFWESSVSGCYYNRTLLESLGLGPAYSQAEFDKLCAALLSVGHIPLCWPADGCSWMIQFGLDPVFADHPEVLEQLNRNEITYADIPAVTDMVQWVADAAKKGWFGDNYLSTGWDEIGPTLTTGAGAMTLIWDTWFYTDFQPTGQYSVDDFAVMPVYMGTAPEGTYEGGNLNMMMVPKDGKQVDAVLDFLSFCAVPDHYNAAFDGISTVSCFQGQTTNIQSPMITAEDAEISIAKYERVSTASTRIVGYNAAEVADAFLELFHGRTDVPGCVRMMDEARIARAKLQGAPGF